MPKPKLIEREILNSLLDQSTEYGECSILLGARQVGKTTLMKEVEKYALKNNLKATFLDLENPQTLLEFNKTDAEIYEWVTGLKSKLLFFDEFHYIPNASKLFKAIIDSKHKIKIFASGSSALEAHKHLKESLAGRKMTQVIHPFSFKEFCKSNKQYSLDKYLVWGGLPGLIHQKSEEDKIKALNNLLSTYILKDIKALVKEENIRAFNHLIQLLAYNEGQVAEVNNLANEIKLSVSTTEKYLEILNQTYIVYPIHSFSKNLSNELKKSKKYYFYDTGIRNLIINNMSPIKQRDDKGALYENYVFNFLNRNILPNMQLRFWRTKDKKEIDFILLKNQKPYLIEVKSSMKKPQIPSHIKNFIKHYKNTEAAFIINEDHNFVIEHEGVEIHFIRIEDLETNETLRNIVSKVN